MKNTNTMNDKLNQLIEALGQLIPLNTGISQDFGEYRINVSNLEGRLGIDIVPNKYDDTEIKELIANFKRNIDKLDDCLFLEVLDEIKDHLDIKTFNELTEQDSYSEEDAKIVKSMINFTNLVVHEHIVNKIQDLEELLNEF